MSRPALEVGDEPAVFPVHPLGGYPFTDVTSGFKIANRRGIDFYCRNLPAEYLGDTIDITAMAISSWPAGASGAGACT